MATKTSAFRAVLTLSLAAALSGCVRNQSDAEIERLRQALDQVESTRQREQTHLAAFDDLDFNVYSGQRWDELGKSHAQDITVHWPDGRTTEGIEAHIEDLKAMFVFAPDTHIREHPIRIASGDWTAVTGFLEGTFTQPMPAGDGKMVPPTGKPFKVAMVTIAHWREGVMDEEWLMWDNQTFMRQIGLAQ